MPVRNRADPRRRARCCASGACGSGSARSGCSAASTSIWAPARSSPSSARTGPASRRWCSASRARRKPTADGSTCTRANPTRAGRANRIAVVWQDLALCDNLSAIANLFLGNERLHNRLLDEAAMAEEGRQLFARLRIAINDPLAPVATLSAGNGSSSRITRAVLREPSLLILDEPTAALGVAATHLGRGSHHPARRGRELRSCSCHTGWTRCSTSRTGSRCCGTPTPPPLPPPPPPPPLPPPPPPPPFFLSPPLDLRSGPAGSLLQPRQRVASAPHSLWSGA